LRRRDLAVLAHQKSHARIFASDGRDHCAGPIRAVIVDDQNLVGMIEWIENGTNVAEQAADVFLFTESGNYQGQLFPQLRRGSFSSSFTCIENVWFIPLRN